MFLYAFHPVSFWYSTRFASETITIPAMLFSTLLAERFFEMPNGLTAAQLGLAVGLSALTISACVILLPVILIFAFYKWRKNVRLFIPYLCIVMVSYTTVQSLWLVRNYALSGEIVPFTTNSGVMFFIGNETVKQFDVKRNTVGNGPDETGLALYRASQD